MKWTIEATAWVGLCPIWLAEKDTLSPVPIPRPMWLGWWLECNFWIIDEINMLITIFNPENYPGYVFYNVTEVEPFEIEI